MKKVSSVVWRFFERIEENKRCVSVVCKLCENQYKYFGNTTNLRVHLTNKHPIQWELTQNGTLDESNFRFEDGDSIQSSSTPQKRKYTPRGSKNVRYSVSIDNNEESTGTMPTIDIQRVPKILCYATISQTIGYFGNLISLSRPIDRFILSIRRSVPNTSQVDKTIYFE